MSTFTIEKQPARAENVTLTDEAITVDLTDGRTISVPLAWFPRLVHSEPAERANWRWIGEREGIHWPDLDEDIRVADLLAGIPSTESQRSFKRWLAKRTSRTPQPGL